MKFFATAPRGLEGLLADELTDLGLTEVHPTRGGVAFAGGLDAAMRACLWSRLANRILLPLAEFEAADGDQLYAGAKEIDWQQHLDLDTSFAVGASLVKASLTHSRYAALRVKDAIVDQFREATGKRPDVAPREPDLQLNLHVERTQATLSIDLSGESLHRRGYRLSGGAAPLKENLAAALLIRSGWPAMAASGAPLLDPFCGSGTLLIEAALMAGDRAPCLGRQRFGFHGWKGFDSEAWQAQVLEAEERAEKGKSKIPQLFGYDADPKAVSACRQNMQTLDLAEIIQLQRQPVQQLCNPLSDQPGLVVANPPYGERLGEYGEVLQLYGAFGARLQAEFSNWRLTLLTGDLDLARSLPFRPIKKGVMEHGGQQRHLLQFELQPERTVGSGGDEVVAFANRLRKTLKRLKPWLKREKVSCFRIYDRDLPEFALAVDRYGDWLHVQEYAAPDSIDPNRARRRLAMALGALTEVTGIPPERLVLKARSRQRGSEQYGVLQRTGERVEVDEAGLKFGLNLRDYLDTGLFLDHRPTRLLLGRLAAGKSFLNLFCYTGTATVHAAAGGASRSLSVDLSRTYIDQTLENLRRNRLAGPQHRLEQADCVDWIGRMRQQFDLIFLDPPTFSNSKRMRESFDIQRDHGELLQSACERLTADGVLLFSTNARKFSLDTTALAGRACLDLTEATMPPDFPRRPPLHRCWIIARRQSVIDGLTPVKELLGRRK